ncbi:MAG TPA: hypothetical protein VGO07_07140 [Candidatus Saccharimonadales bacterium]|nr:hypothetical protein [Candidatus Saccharimonadales bacterium]
MKTTKPPVSKRTKPVKTTKKTLIKHARPLHKRVLLHPFSVMVVLCAGVILAGSTYQSLAASYDVTATVSAPPITVPAVIGTPANSQHVSSQQVTVLGTCPAAAYVKLYRGATFSGTSACTASVFQVQTSLLPGVNQLQAKVYNVTNDEGPPSAPITVYYDETIAAPPATPVATPATLQITNVESADYQEGSIQSVSSRPTVSGYALPYADIVVTFHSEVAICKTQADAQGWWTCTLDHALPDGIHHVDVTASNNQGWSAVLPTFEIRVRSFLPNLLKLQPSTPSLIITSEYKFQTHYVGQPFTWTLGLNGGTAPYTVSIAWGDDSQSVFNRTNGDRFDFTHAYPLVKTYDVFIKATDAKGVSGLLQLNAVVKGQATGVASLTSSGPLASLFSSVQRYLWIVWPVYLAVVLMVSSYWLGEQDIYQRMRGRRVAAAGRKR